MRNLYKIFIAITFLSFSLYVNAQEKVKIGILTNGDACNVDWKNQLSGYELIDAGVKNFLVGQQGWELDRRLFQYKPDYCIIYGGLPDILLQQPLKNISDAYKYLCSQLIQNGIKPILLQTLPVRNHPAVNSLISQLNSDLQVYAAQNNIYCCDPSSVLVLNSELSAEYSSDGFMLNDRGLDCFAQNVLAYIDDLVAMNTNTVVSQTTAHNLVSTAISNIMATSPKNVNIVMLGNSITANAKNWNKWLKRKDTHNAGQGGYTTGQMLWHMDTTVISLHPKICFVMAGINDLFNNISPDVILRNQIRILTKLKANNIKPVLQLTLYTHDNPALAKRVDEINDAIKNYCEQEGIDVIDLNILLSNDKSLKKEYTTDGTHLTDAAYRIWSDELTRYLAEKLK